MKQNVDLFRQILLTLEEQDEISDTSSEDLEIEGYTEDQIVYHLLLLKDAGYIIAEKETYISQSKPHVIIERITKAGHDFLNTARDDKRWIAAKSAAEKAGSLTLEVIARLLLKMFMDNIGLQ